jgi:tetratricopeptide (TPR) repeat protein
MAKQFKEIAEALPIDPKSLSPKSASDFSYRGWLYYSQKDFALAEEDFHASLDSNPDNIDDLFALGLTLKAAGKLDQAVNIFEKILGLLDTLPDKIRAHMLHRLVMGHINQIKIGNWHLEKEIWHVNT